MACAWPFIESITFKMPTMGQFLTFGVIVLIIAIVAVLVLMHFFIKEIKKENRMVGRGRLLA